MTELPEYPRYVVGHDPGCPPPDYGLAECPRPAFGKSCFSLDDGLGCQYLVSRVGSLSRWRVLLACHKWHGTFVQEPIKRKTKAAQSKKGKDNILGELSAVNEFSCSVLSFQKAYFTEVEWFPILWTSCIKNFL